MNCSKLLKLSRVLRRGDCIRLRSESLVRHNSGYSDNNQTHFGYQTVGEEEKRDKVLGVFHNVADK